jgi:dephospho-CoA kinase
VAGGEARVPFVGLTGGIGAGKTEALRALERLGAATLSSDAVVHDLLAEDDEVKQAIVERFGEHVAPGGEIDRSRVAEHVFERPDEREWLEGLLWPRVGQRIAAWRERLSDEAEPPRAAVVESPLLFEAGMERAFDATVAVVASDHVRERRTADREQAGGGQREERQLSQGEKAERADFVVENDGDLADLEARMSELLETLTS